MRERPSPSRRWGRRAPEPWPFAPSRVENDPGALERRLKGAPRQGIVEDATVQSNDEQTCRRTWWYSTWLGARLALFLGHASGIEPNGDAAVDLDDRVVPGSHRAGVHDRALPQPILAA